MKNVIDDTAQEIALFVFIPFCKIKCTYCDFNAYANLNRVMAPYAQAVAREIRLAGQGTAGGRRAKSLYFGGGTPSVVPVADIESIMHASKESFILAEDAEITLEGNPGTVDLDRLGALRGLGINRLSLGVQSFDEATVKRLNRGHTAAEAIETFDLARQAGFGNINLDLIYGLPLQTLEDWRSSLSRALDLWPEHLSLYALKVEEGTGLEQQIARGKYPMPDDDLAADMYQLAEEMLDVAGYEHYEISNWAKPDLFSRHNLTYWHEEPYLGFGAGAHSYLGNERSWNVLSPVDYIDRIQRGASVRAGSERIDRELEMAEAMILGLRLGEGVAFKAFCERFGEDPRDKYGSSLNEAYALRLVDLTEERARLTPRGRLLSNQVFWRFLPD